MPAIAVKTASIKLVRFDRHIANSPEEIPPPEKTVCPFRHPVKAGLSGAARGGPAAMFLRSLDNPSRTSGRKPEPAKLPVQLGQKLAEFGQWFGGVERLM
jgi:hypothetical protein